ncbi:SDR family NAD(P)-dependent oxidoreductase [Burkholderia sp. Bp9143]|uniref:SDR family NAD(P)-dependent oxidoreductase n=1 Tax=Burkholderia sp. Bp9143 TaxID=2184574 RepID=UPI00162787EC|nr:SDR family NAD(P)-dependent oxidoreductase [Burkholderia sp. Bp9143]
MANILVTGAARGIGRSVVERALARGDTVYAMVRKTTDIHNFPPVKELHVVQMNVANTDSVAEGFDEVDRLLNGAKLNGIVHCAAISMPGAIELTADSEFESILNTNAMGSLRILRAAIPRLRGHNGRLVLVTSLWGQASGPLLGAYCASKHAIESMADTARRETAGMNLHIVVAEPGVVLTDMLTSQAPAVQHYLDAMSAKERSLYGALYKRYFRVVSSAAGITAERCAAHIDRALFSRRPPTRYRIGNDSKIVCLLNWLLPDRWMDRMMALSLNNKPLPADLS